MNPPRRPMMFGYLTISPSVHGGVLSAQVSLASDTYISAGAPINDGRVDFLKLTPLIDMDGGDITFYVNGMEAATHAIFQHGDTIFNLVIKMPPPEPVPSPPQRNTFWQYIKEIIRWIMRRR